MERIEPLRDHGELERLGLGDEMIFLGERWKVSSRTTLATGEPGLVLQKGSRQFLVSFTELCEAGFSPLRKAPEPRLDSSEKLG